jgi:hypothetical protein
LTRRRSAAAVAALAAAALVVGAILHRSSGLPNADATHAKALAAEVSRLPPPEQPAFRVGRPKLLSRHETRARYAPVLQETIARAAPAPDARPVAPIQLRTPEGTSNIVLVTGERMRSDGLWIHIRLTVLPNGRTGWVPRRALGGYRFVHTHLVVDQSRLRATLYRDGREVFSAPVGVGRRPVLRARRVRNERALGDPDRLARRRVRRDPRDERARADPRPHLPRLRAPPQSRHPRAEPADARRDAGDGPLERANGFRRPSARRRSCSGVSQDADERSVRYDLPARCQKQ